MRFLMSLCAARLRRLMREALDGNYAYLLTFLVYSLPYRVCRLTDLQP
jgi:hypothetical protein